MSTKQYLSGIVLGISNSTCENRVKSTKLHAKLIFSIPRVDMEAVPRDITSLEAKVAADMQVEEDEERADVNNSTEK